MILKINGEWWDSYEVPDNGFMDCYGKSIDEEVICRADSVVHYVFDTAQLEWAYKVIFSTGEKVDSYVVGALDFVEYWLLPSGFVSLF